MTSMMDLNNRICHVCGQDFSQDQDGFIFALHLAECTNTGSSLPSTVAENDACPACHHVYTNENTIAMRTFHEEHCMRVNDTIQETTAQNTDTLKRRRDQENININEENKISRQILYPTYCCVCTKTSRHYLTCLDHCKRTFHSHCVKENGVLLNQELRQRKENYDCGECYRQVYSCMKCQYLGHVNTETNDTMEFIQCRHKNCGFYYHKRCLSLSENENLDENWLCPRHVCTICKKQERQMELCQVCTRCVSMKHITCIESTENVSMEPYHDCEKHQQNNVGELDPIMSLKVTTSLKKQFVVGDIVLILEYENNLLPQTAKDIAPLVYNQWGIIVGIEGNGETDQSLLSQMVRVTLFTDGSTLTISNKYLLPLGYYVNQFSSPEILVRECLKWHTVVELELRYLYLVSNGKIRHETFLNNLSIRNAILEISCSAFQNRAQSIGLGIDDLIQSSYQGYEVWAAARTSSTAITPFQGTQLPIFVYLDTRSKAHKANNKDQLLEQLVVAPPTTTKTNQMTSNQATVDLTSTLTQNQSIGSTTTHHHAMQPERRSDMALSLNNEDIKTSISDNIDTTKMENSNKRSISDITDKIEDEEEMEGPLKKQFMDPLVYSAAMHKHLRQYSLSYLSQKPTPQRQGKKQNTMQLSFKKSYEWERPSVMTLLKQYASNRKSSGHKLRSLNIVNQYLLTQDKRDIPCTIIRSSNSGILSKKPSCISFTIDLLPFRSIQAVVNELQRRLLQIISISKSKSTPINIQQCLYHYTGYDKKSHSLHQLQTTWVQFCLDVQTFQVFIP